MMLIRVNHAESNRVFREFVPYPKNSVKPLNGLMWSDEYRVDMRFR